jgi:hypothetical protein
MHLLLEHVMKQLLELWSGLYKVEAVTGSDRGKQSDSFGISAQSWERMDDSMAASIKLIPSKMTRSPTSTSARPSWTAGMYNFFLPQQYL